MLHQDGIEIFLRHNGVRYKDFAVPRDGAEWSGPSYPGEVDGRYHTAVSQAMVRRKLEVEEDENVTLSVKFNRSFKLYAATALRVCICIGHEGHNSAKFYVLTKADLMSRRYIGFEFGRGDPMPLPAEDGPKPWLGLLFSREMMSKGREANPGSVTVYLTRGHDKAARDGAFNRGSTFKRLRGPNGNQYCFEFQCIAKDYRVEPSQEREPSSRKSGPSELRPSALGTSSAATDLKGCEKTIDNGTMRTSQAQQNARMHEASSHTECDDDEEMPREQVRPQDRDEDVKNSTTAPGQVSEALQRHGISGESLVDLGHSAAAAACPPKTTVDKIDTTSRQLRVDVDLILNDDGPVRIKQESTQATTPVEGVQPRRQAEIIDEEDEEDLQDRLEEIQIKRKLRALKKRKLASG